jgi:hypothetical protein
MVLGCRAMKGRLAGTVGALSLLLLGARPARGDPFADHPQSHTFLAVGAFGDVGGHFGHGNPGTGVAMAGGLELSAIHWAGRVGEVLESARYGLGGFAQLEAVRPDGHARGALGIQANLMAVGMELGVVMERGSGPYATSAGLHVAPFVSLGIVYLGVRAELPVASMSSGTVYGPGLALVLGLKAPITLDGGTILDSSTFH